MAVVEFSKKDLEQLTGRKFSDDDYKNKLPMLGCPLEKLDAKKIYYEISPNRPDLYSVEGFARAIRNFLGISKKAPSYKIEKPKIKMAVERVEARPSIVAAVARNVKLDEELLVSLIQLQEKLHDTLGRKRKKVAIGIHDLDKVTPPFKYIAAKPETSFVPLDTKSSMSMMDILKKHPKGRDYARLVEKYDRYPLIIDKNNNVISFPPIINGELTRLTEKIKNLFIDVTGTNEMAINQALNILVTALYERGCKVEAVKVGNRISPNLRPQRMKLDIDYANKLLGTQLKQNEVKMLLAKMGIAFQNNEAVIPAYRIDIMHQMDLAEEIAIALGYSHFEPRLPRVVTIARRDEMNEFIYFLRRIMIGLGMQEVVSMVLTNKEAQFKNMEMKEEVLCETMNPLTVECTACRKNLLPSLLNILSQNKHREYPQLIFEIGDVVQPDTGEETGAMHSQRLAGCITDSAVNYEQIVSALDVVMKNLGVAYKLSRTEHSSFMPGRVAGISNGLGIIGEIHPKVIENWKIEKPVIAFEVDVTKLFGMMQR